MFRRSKRNDVLLIVFIVLSIVGLFVFDQMTSGRGTNPREVLGRVPEEWRELGEQVLVLILMFALVGSWFAALLLFKQATQFKLGEPICAACDYSLSALPEKCVCPECGSAKRQFSRQHSIQRRLIAVGIVQGCGVITLLICLLSIASDSVGLMLFHTVMTLPVMLVAKDKRLTASEAAFVSGMMLLTISSLTVYSIWDSTHSGDGQAAFGLLGASCSGWLFAGPGYLVSAIGVWAYRWQQPNRNKSESE